MTRRARHQRSSRRRGRKDPQLSLFDQPVRKPTSVNASAPVTPAPVTPARVTPAPQVPVVPTAASAAPGSIDADFVRFHESNPAVYAHFLGEARMDLQEQGQANVKRHREGFPVIKVWLSAKEIFEKLRKSPAIVTKGDGFKLNNNFPALYARMAMEENPDLRGFFRLRRRIGES